MKRSRTIVLSAALIMIAAGVFAWFLNRGPERVDDAAGTPGNARVTGAVTAKVAPPVLSVPAVARLNRAPSAAPTSEQRRPPEDVLNAFSSSDTKSRWKSHLEAGRPLRFTGGRIRAVVGDPARENQLLGELGVSLGLGPNVVFHREQKSTGNLTIVDQQQRFMFESGTSFPVFGAKLRVFANRLGEIFMIQNETRTVDLSIEDTPALAAAEAIQIVAAHLQDQEFELRIYDPSLVVYADDRPHQLAVQVLSSKVGSSRLLLVGQSTRTVIRDIELTRN
ncbi:MAG: hypothetical protein AB7G93_13785 [Bdellovibrionales bacterium]